MDTAFSITIGRHSSPSACCSGADTLAELVASLADTLAFYRIVADWHDMTIDVAEYCKRCNGSGEVSAARRGKFKRCPACKGSPIVRQSSADVKAMTETSCIAIRNRERAANEAYLAARQSA